MVASRTQETILEEMGAESAGVPSPRQRRRRPEQPQLFSRRLTARELLAGSLLEVARGLLGWTFLHDGCGGRIVEVEAYAPDDPASHAFRGRTQRNASMFACRDAVRLPLLRDPLCANVVCEPKGTAAAVLLRALEPTHGLAEMRKPPGRRRDQASARARAG